MAFLPSASALEEFRRREPVLDILKPVSCAEVYVPPSKVAPIRGRPGKRKIKELQAVSGGKIRLSSAFVDGCTSSATAGLFVYFTGTREEVENGKKLLSELLDGKPISEELSFDKKSINC